MITASRTDLSSFVSELDSAPVDQKIDVVADFFGIKRSSEIPRPGAVAGYSHAQWRQLAADVGLIEVDRSKHSYMYRHPILGRVVLAPASSTGENHSQMNCMQDFRRLYRDEVQKITTLTSLFGASVVENEDTVDTFKERVINALEHYSEWDTAALRATKTNVEPMAPLSDIVKYANILRTEFNLQYRSSIYSVCDSVAEAATIQSRVTNSKLLTGVVNVPARIRDNLRDLLETMRKVEQEKRENQRLEREKPAMTAQLEVVHVPGTVPHPIPEAPKDAFSREQARLTKSIQDQITIATEAMSRINILQTLKPNVDLIWREAADMTKVALDGAQIRIDAAEEKVKILEQTLHETEATNPWESRMRELVNKLSAQLAENDIMKLVFNLDEARKLLTEAKGQLSGPNQ